MCYWFVGEWGLDRLLYLYTSPDGHVDGTATANIDHNTDRQCAHDHYGTPDGHSHRYSTSHGYHHPFADPVADFYINRSTDDHCNLHTYRDADANAGIHPHPDWDLA